MKIFHKTVGTVTVLEPEGKITIGDGDVILREAIQHLLNLGEKRILLNMARVSYMDSSGVGELISCMQNVKASGGEFKLLNLSTKIRDLLHIAQILSVFEYFNDEKAALESFA